MSLRKRGLEPAKWQATPTGYDVLVSISGESFRCCDGILAHVPNLILIVAV
jgi:hypothetical protein